MADITEKILLEVKLDVAILQKSAADATASLKLLRAEHERLTKAGDTNSLAYKQNAQAISLFNKQLNDATKALAINDSLQKNNTGSLADLRLQLIAATSQYKLYSAEQQKSSEDAIALAAQIRKLSDTIKAQEIALGNASRNVGNYKDALDPIKQELIGVRTETTAISKSLLALNTLQSGSARLFGENSVVASGFANVIQGLVGFEELLNVKTGIKIALASADVISTEAQTAAMGAETVATGTLTTATEALGAAFTATWAAATAGIALLVIGIAVLLEKMGALETADALRARLAKESLDTFNETSKAEYAATIQQATADLDRAKAKKKSADEIFELQQKLFDKEIAAYRDLQAQKGFLEFEDEIRLEQLEKDRLTAVVANDQRIKEQQLKDLKALADARIILSKIGSEKELAAKVASLKAARDIELADETKSAAEKYELQVKFNHDVLLLNAEFKKKQIQDQIDVVEAQLNSDKLNGEEIYKLKFDLLEKQKQAALTDITLTEAERLKIVSDTDKAELQLADEFNKQLSDIRILNLEAALVQTRGNAQERLAVELNLLAAQHDADVLNEQAKIQSKELTDAKIRKIDADYLKSYLDLLQQQINASIAAQGQGQTQTRAQFEAARNQEINNAKELVNTLFEINQNSLDTRIQQIEEEEKAGKISKEKAHKEIAALKRKEAQANKDEALFNIGVNLAQAIMKLTAQLGVAAPGAIALEVALAAVQAAAVISRPIPAFAEGGLSGKKVTSRDGVPIQRSNGDNLLATIRTGEVILNEQHQRLLGGAATFRAIGVPGFAQGGLLDGGLSFRAATPDSSNLDLLSVLDLIADKSPVVRVVDINNVQGNVARIESAATI